MNDVQFFTSFIFTDTMTASSSPPSDSRRDRKRQQTANRLVETAFGLFAAHGYDSVTMEQIAAAADVAKGTLYNHFPVKEALIRHRFHADLGETLPRMLAELQGLPTCQARLRRFFQATAAYAEARREYMGAYVRIRLAEPMNLAERGHRSGMDRFYAQLLAEGQAKGEIKADLPPQALANHLMFLHMGCLLNWLQAPGLSLEKEFDRMLDLFLDGAVPRCQP